MMRRDAIACLASLALAAAAADGPASGRDVVTASSFGWNAEDATKCLQAALDSGAKKVIVDRKSVV